MAVDKPTITTNEIHRFLLSSFLVIAFSSPLCLSQSTTAKNTTNVSWFVEDPGPYCGILSSYCGLKTLGASVRLDQLVKPEYIGSASGSSMEELSKAAKDCGASAMPVDGLTTQMLAALDQPAILHVLSATGTGEYDHWILFRGKRNNAFVIFDPAHSFNTMTEGSLAEIWDGKCLVLGARDIPQIRLQQFTLVCTCTQLLALYSWRDSCLAADVELLA